MRARLAALALLLAAALAPAAAAPLAHAPRIRLRQGTSSNWAGYAVETDLAAPQNGAVSDVVGQWTVPAVTCGAGDAYSAVWVGIDGDADNTVEQTGTEQDCVGGQPSYSAWYELYPHRSYSVALPVDPGSTVRAEVRYAGGSSFVLTLTIDGATFRTTQRLNAKRQSAEWIVEAPYSGGVLPLADFGTVAFGGAQATLDGQAGAIGAWPADPITMATAGGTVKAQPSGLTLGASGFGVTWQHS
jgi:hypothetical protein